MLLLILSNKTSTFLSCICFLLFSTISNCQSILSFSGLLIPENLEPISYTIEIKSTKNDSIFGQSITELDSDNKIYSIIAGRIDTTQNLLSFVESVNITTERKVNPNIFCFVNCRELKIIDQEKNTKIIGNFIGKYPDGSQCANGKIVLSGKLDHHVLFPPVLEPKDSILTSKPAFDLILTSGESTIIHSEREDLVISLWDANVEDNDLVNIYVDGEELAENVVLNNKKKYFPINQSSKTHTITIEALNNGNIGINTVSIFFNNSLQEEVLTTSLKKGESCTIDVTNKFFK